MPLAGEANRWAEMDGVAGMAWPARGDPGGSGWPRRPDRLPTAAFPGTVFSLHLKRRIYYSKTTIGGISHEQ
ncbi:hypothetical protein C7256_04330 [Enterocloster lavalensis]|nr:hypothetical protein C7256_04330 [Enterocloster lavalensis]